MTGWVCGHPVYKDIWKSGITWNGVMNMCEMHDSTDIPDWLFACTKGAKVDWPLTAEDNALFYQRSPISVARNVKVPMLHIIGAKDARVPSP